MNLKAKVLLLLGRGIRESILERADYKLKISMASDIDSLNASMSCAVILYQLFSR